MVSGESCVLVAGRHPLVTEAIRGLLETAFDAVVLVADRGSLLESARRLQPNLAIVELALGQGDLAGSIVRLRAGCAALMVLVIDMHDEPNLAESVVRTGADAFVSTRNVAAELLPAVVAWLGQRLDEVVGHDRPVEGPEDLP